MNQVSPTVISIGYGRHLFQQGNPERERMKKCAHETNTYHMVIFTSRTDNLAIQKVDEKLTLHPTASRDKLLMLWDAYQITSNLVSGHKNGRLVVTAQDPFETALIGYLVKLRHSVHLTIQEHADVFSTNYWRQESIGNRLRFQLGKFLLRKADVVRVVSERIEKTMQKMDLKAKLTRLPVSVDIRSFLQARHTKVASEGDEFWFLSVARFVPQKNLSLMIKAFAEAHQKNPNIRLRLVGQGPEKQAVEVLIAKQFSQKEGQRPPIVIESWSDDVPGLMWSSDAYLLTSNYEGWARVLIEAMVSELPIVTTDVGCAGEVVVSNQHGLVVPVDDQDSLVKAILQISTDKELYSKIKHNLSSLETEKLPGARINTYGQDWVSTLE